MRMTEDIEAIIIGLALANPEMSATFGIASHEFSDPDYRAVWGSILHAIGEGRLPELWFVVDRTPHVNQGEILEIWKNARSIQNLSHYLNLFHRQARARRTRHIAERIIENIDAGKNSDTVRSKALELLADVGSSSTDAVKNQHDVVMCLVDYLETVSQASKSNSTIGVPTGIGWLDKATGGMHKSNLIVIGARPAMGNTALATTIAVNAAMRGYRVGFVSTEMSTTELALRQASLVSGVPGEMLRDGNLSSDDYTAITAATTALDTLPIRVVDKPSCRVSDVVCYARSLMLQGGIDLLIVDYLQRLMPDDNRAENRTREIGRAAVAMKNIARQNQIPVLLLSQVNRASATSSDKRPTMAQLRDSGEIEQEADQVWLLHRPCVFDENADPREAEIIIEKNRHGPTAFIRCVFNTETMRWASSEPEESYRYA